MSQLKNLLKTREKPVVSIDNSKQFIVEQQDTQKDTSSGEIPAVDNEPIIQPEMEAESEVIQDKEIIVDQVEVDENQQKPEDTVVIPDVQELTAKDVVTETVDTAVKVDQDVTVEEVSVQGDILENYPFSPVIYSQTLEHTVLSILNESGRSNISMSVFGEHARLYEPQNLMLIKYKGHTFISKPRSDEDYWETAWSIETYVLSVEKLTTHDSKKGVPVKLVNTFSSSGIVYTTLLLTEEEVSRYSNSSKRKLAVNKPIDDKGLVVVVYGQ